MRNCPVKSKAFFSRNALRPFLVALALLFYVVPASAERTASFAPPMAEGTATGAPQRSILVAPEAFKAPPATLTPETPELPVISPPTLSPPPSSVVKEPEAKKEPSPLVSAVEKASPKPSMPAATSQGHPDAASSALPSNMPAVAPDAAQPPTTKIPEISPPPLPASPARDAPPHNEAVVENSPPKEAPTSIAKPVATAALPDVDPDTLGLFSPNEGGLGSAMWNGTPRAFVDRLLPDAAMPMASPTLNDLARRLLLSSAVVPAGEKGKDSRSLMSLRLEKLLALGDADAAWRLANLTKPDRIDAATMRAVTEMALIGPDSKVLCDNMSAIMAAHDHEDWQKALVLCQLRGGDGKAVQLSLDVMREQRIKDDIFIMLAHRAVLNDGRRLPHQLSPLRPLSLGVLRHIDAPLPFDVFMRPEAALVPELLKAKAEDDSARLILAERSVARGIIGADRLADVYKSVAYAPEALADALNSRESGSKLRALLYQAALQESSPQKKAELIVKFIQSADSAFLAGGVSRALAGLAEAVPPTPDSNIFAAMAARLFVLADRPDRAMEWLKIAQGPARVLPNIESETQINWPLYVLGGVVADVDYGKELNEWVGKRLKDPALDAATLRTRRQQVGNLLVLFNAAGFAVPEETWLPVMESLGEGRRIPLPSAVLLERLRHAAQGQRRGETVLLGLLLGGGGASETPVFVWAEIVRSLRMVGLTAEALSLAREAAVGISTN